MKYEISNYKLDIQDFLNIENESFKKSDGKLNIRNFVYHIKRQNPIFIVRIDGKIVAYALFLKYKKSLRLYSLGVLKSFRDKGYAKSILLDGIEFAKKYKLEQITLEVRESNISAICLYKKFGFIKKGVKKNYYLDGESAIKMSRKI